jgi:hypothetical protein
LQGGFTIHDMTPSRLPAGQSAAGAGAGPRLVAGLQDAVSGYLIQGFKQGSGPAAHYDFVPVGLFWVGAAVASALVTALIWQLSQRAAAEIPGK